MQLTPRLNLPHPRQLPHLPQTSLQIPLHKIKNPRQVNHPLPPHRLKNPKKLLQPQKLQRIRPLPEQNEQHPLKIESQRQLIPHGNLQQHRQQINRKR